MRTLVLVLAVALAVPALAETRQVPQAREEISLSFAPVVKNAAPAVVNVYASRTEKVQRNPLFDDPVFRQFFGEGGNAGPRSQTQRSLGSGVIVDPSGLVVTNYHVIDQMTDVKVALADGSEYPAEIALRDPAQRPRRAGASREVRARFRRWRWARPTPSRWATSHWRSAIPSAWARR